MCHGGVSLSDKPVHPIWWGCLFFILFVLLVACSVLAGLSLRVHTSCKILEVFPTYKDSYSFFYNVTVSFFASQAEHFQLHYHAAGKEYTSFTLSNLQDGHPPDVYTQLIGVSKLQKTTV